MLATGELAGADHCQRSTPQQGRRAGAWIGVDGFALLAQQCRVVSDHVGFLQRGIAAGCNRTRYRPGGGELLDCLLLLGPARQQVPAVMHQPQAG